MAHYIDKDRIVAEIEKFMYSANLEADIASTGECFDEKVARAKYQLCKQIRDSIVSLEVKEVDVEKEINKYISDNFFGSETIGFFSNRTKEEPNDGDIALVAKHFFELGLSVNNPVTAADRGTAEEIIINLKRVEQDYRIDLTKEIEWARNQVKKGE